MKPKLTALAACALLASAMTTAPRPARGDDAAAKTSGVPTDSVVKILVSIRSPDPLHPWTKQTPRDGSGTGVVIEGKRVLTNAHVVTYASQIFVETSESGDKHVATVESIGPGIDLAVLKLEDESFFDKRPPIPRGHDLPAVKDAVLVYGFPQGGASLSVTKGIVSRIEFAPYGEQTLGLRVQVDAAINPGNSGGPALIDGKVVGLIFSKLNQSENIGYIIPSEEIDLFLDDVKDGTYDGKPRLHDQFQTLENAALRAKLGLDRKTTGLVVHAPDRDDPDYPLKEWDLITRVGDHDVDNTGMVRVTGDLRLPAQYLVQKLTRNGRLPLTLVRGGKEVKAELPVVTHRDQLIEPLRGRYPSYFVYGPLAFTTVTAEFLAGLERGGDRLISILGALGSPIVLRRGDRPAFPGEELVLVAAPIFPHRISKGYSSPFSRVVKEVDGVRVKNLRHLVELFRDGKDKFTTIAFYEKGSETLVFDRKEALAATEDVLNDNGIRQRASDDLTPVWSAGAGAGGAKSDGGR